MLSVAGATDLSATFAEQGLKIRVRKDPRSEPSSYNLRTCETDGWVQNGAPDRSASPVRTSQTTSSQRATTNAPVPNPCHSIAHTLMATIHLPVIISTAQVQVVTTLPSITHTPQANTCPLRQSRTIPTGCPTHPNR